MTSWLAFLTHDLLSFLTVAVLVSLLLLETGCQDPQANFKYHCVVEDDSELIQPPRPPGFQSPVSPHMGYAVPRTESRISTFLPTVTTGKVLELENIKKNLNHADTARPRSATEEQEPICS